MVILIVDDNAEIRTALAEILNGHETREFENGLEALHFLEKTSVDVVITDNQMPKMTGLELIKKGREKSPNTAFLLMTAFGTVEDAVEAMRIGAEDYFIKPFNASEILHRLRRIEDLCSFKAERELKEESRHGVQRLVGASGAMDRAREFVAQVAGAVYPVLILGPSGSGKEVMAKAIHESGLRASRPFVAINCASLSETLLESELFGHEKGAFTGASAAKPGKFELARGGTLFLDEAGELTPAIQARLLRVLQDQEFFRVGGIRQIKTDARVIAATHRPIKEMVRDGSFREDLFFRLNVLTFELPPLAQRREDIRPLVDFFWGRLCAESGRKIQLGAATLENLESYSYPGNIRELQNVLERLVVMAAKETEVLPHHLPPEFFGKAEAPRDAAAFRTDSKGKTLSQCLEDYERHLILGALEKAGHNQREAAKLLGITRGAIQYRMRKLGVSVDDEQQSIPIRKAA